MTETTTGVRPRSARVELSPHAELAVLARALFRDGYNEHNSGHISFSQPDGSLLVTPRGLAWDQLRASDIMRIDHDGNILDGVWDITPALELHLALHRVRNAGVVIHQHPQWSTVWASAGRIPPIYDQTSGYLGGPLSLVDEYSGEVFDSDAAARTVQLLGESNAALLANHGVLVIGDNVRQAHQRAVAVEWRCRLAWRVQALNPDAAPLAAQLVADLERSINARGGYLPHLFDSEARREIRLDAGVID